MKRNRIPALLLALLFTLAALTACGASYGGANGTAELSATADTAAAPEMGEDAEGGYGFTEESTVSVPGLSGGAYSADVKLIYTGNLTLQCTDLDTAIQGISALVDSFGGYFESQEIYRNSSHQSACYTVRVPGAQYYDFLNSISEYDGCKVVYQSSSIDDVGEQYADIENRLATLQAKLERLRELLGQAENMEDIITIESELSDVEYEIESLTGQKNHYDSLISYSTVYIDLNEVSALSEGVNPGLGERLSAGFAGGMENFARGCTDLLVWLVSNLIGVLIFLAAVVAVLVLLAHRRKKRKARRTAPDRQEQSKEQSKELS